jgi:hypothetical protein
VLHKRQEAKMGQGKRAVIALQNKKSLHPKKNAGCAQ